MNKFKVGDVVRCVQAGSGRLVVGALYTVSRTDTDETIQVGDTYWWRDGRFELANSKAMEREELSKAIDVMGKHDVRRYYCGGKIKYVVGDLGTGNKSVGAVLDFLFPTKTPEQLEIEVVEGKLRVLAAQLAVLKER